MQRVERGAQQNANGSTTVTRKLVEDVSMPYGGVHKVVISSRSHVDWPKSRDIIPNVPSRRRRMELLGRV